MIKGGANPFKGGTLFTVMRFSAPAATFDIGKEIAQAKWNFIAAEKAKRNDL